MNGAIENYINGNLADAKRLAKRKGWLQLLHDAQDDYGMSFKEARAVANYLKGQGTFQAACDAKPH